MRQTDLSTLERLVEALLFAEPEPLSPHQIAQRLPADLLPDDQSPTAVLTPVLDRLAADYQGRGISLVQRGSGWAFRTAADLTESQLTRPTQRQSLSRAALETLAVVAYHQPVTRTEIEGIRGVSLSKSSMDQLIEAGWVRPGPRRETPGRPLTWVTTPAFLDAFGLGSLRDLPGLRDLRDAGLLDRRPAMAMVSEGMHSDQGGLFVDASVDISDA